MSEFKVILSKPHAAQQQIVSEKKRFNVLDCGRRFGKSKLAINLMVETALEGYPVGYFAPTYKLLEGTYRETMLAVKDILRRKHDNQFIELYTNGIIEFWSLENQLAGRSRKYKRAIIDEAAFAKSLQQSWNEAIRPTLTDLKGDAFFMSTPKGKNDFYKFFMRGQSDNDWMSWQMPTSLNPYIDYGEIMSAKEDLPELAYKQEYLAEFNDNVANPFGYDFIRMNIAPLSTSRPVAYGIDLAKSFDYTVIIGMDEFGRVCYFDRFQMNWFETLTKIKQLPNVSGTVATIDSTGVGDPIVEDLQRELINVHGFKFTSKSKQDLMLGLASAIQQRQITYPEGTIVHELESFEYLYTSNGVKYSAPSGLHDDCVMALALCYNGYINNRTSGKYSIDIL